MENWNIQTRSSLCAQCQKNFVEKESCCTVLRASQDGFRREDFCVTCWETSVRGSIQSRDGLISYWQGAYELPSPPPADPLPKEDAESILRRMVERNDPSEKEARYILMVMLERKRIFRQRGTQPGADTTLLVYEHVKTGEVVMIHDPQLHLDKLEDVQKRVAMLLKPTTPATSGDCPSEIVVSPQVQSSS